MSELKDKRVMVVGGSRGIGLGVALAARDAGAELIIASRNPEKVADQFPGADCVSVDANDEESIQGMFEQVGEIDHLVCTQHSTSSDILPMTMAPIRDIDLESSKRFMLSKYWSQFMVLKIGSAYVSKSGSITLTSGVAGRRFVDNHSVIGPNNCAIEGLALYGARELAPLRVNVVSPGLIETPIYDEIHAGLWGELDKKFSEVNPVGRVGSIDDSARAYIYAMTASYVTGSVLDIDGGFLVA